MEFYSDKLLGIRKQSGISIKYLIAQLGISRVTYWNWEQGIRKPSEECVKKVAKLLGIKCSEISDLTYEDEEKSNLFKGDAIVDKILGTRSEELIKLQNKAMAVLKNVSGELNQIWRISEAIFDTLNSYVYIKDIDNRFVITNKPFKENLKLNNNYSVKGKNDFDFFPKRNAQKNLDEDFVILKEKKSIINEIRTIPWSKNKRWGMVSKHPIFDSSNRIAGMLCVIDDITEIRRLEGIRLLLEKAINVSHNIFSIRTKDKLIFVSDSVTQVWDLPIEKFIEQRGFASWLKAMHPDDRRRELIYLKNFDYPEKYQYRTFDQNNELQWVEATALKFEFMGKEYLCRTHKKITKEKNNQFKIARQLLDEGVGKEIIERVLNIDLD